MEDLITGKDLIKWGLKPNKYFGRVIKHINHYIISSDISAKDILEDDLRRLATNTYNNLSNNNNDKYFNYDPVIKEYITYITEEEKENYLQVKEDILKISKYPRIKSIYIMPDACSTGTTPVGSVIVTDGALYPEMHSADMSCSVMLDIYKDPVLFKNMVNISRFSKDILNEEYRKDIPFDFDILDSNLFTKDFKDIAINHFGTCGDGNHFISLIKDNNDKQGIVSHFGSRGFGSSVYKKAKKIADTLTKKRLDIKYKGYSWIDIDDQEYFIEYIKALEIVDSYVEASHKYLHKLISKQDSIEHYFSLHNNIVIKDYNNIIHFKGATQDNNTILPLSMNSPIYLINPSKDNIEGFLPHGAGRNMSRTKFLKTYSEEEIKQSVKNVNIKFYNNIPDYSEYPLAYKDHNKIIDELTRFKLADIIKSFEVTDTIMAGKAL